MTVIDGIGNVLVGRTGGLGPWEPIPVDVLPTEETVGLGIGEEVPIGFEPVEIPALGFDDVNEFGTTPSSLEGEGEEGDTPPIAPVPMLGEELATGLEVPRLGLPPEPVIDAEGMPDFRDIEEAGLESPEPDEEIFGLTK